MSHSSSFCSQPPFLRLINLFRPHLSKEMASPALLRMLATVYILWTCLPLRCAVAKAQLEYPVSTRHFPAHPPDIARPNANVAKRGSDLYSLWNSIPATKVAKGDSAKFFEIDQSEDDAWAIAYLHGCTALMISDPNFVIGTFPSRPMVDRRGRRLLTVVSRSCAARHKTRYKVYRRRRSAR